MADRWDRFGANILASAGGSLDMPVGNAQDFAEIPRAVWVGGAGTIRVVLKDDADGTIRSMTIPTAGFYSFRPRRLVNNGGIAEIWGVR